VPWTAPSNVSVVAVRVRDGTAERRPAVVEVLGEPPDALDAEGVLDVRRVGAREAVQAADEQPRVVDDDGGVALAGLVGFGRALGGDGREVVALDLRVVVVELFDAA